MQKNQLFTTIDYSLLNKICIPAHFLNDSAGKYKIGAKLTEDEIILAAIAIVSSRFLKSDALNSSSLTKNFFILKLSDLEHEVFCTAFLDNQNQIVACEQMFNGTVSESIIYPREIVKRALQLNASSVVFAHNHPGGRLEPSIQDRKVTRILIKALELVDVKVLDHLIIGKGQALSFTEEGLL